MNRNIGTFSADDPRNPSDPGLSGKILTRNLSHFWGDEYVKKTFRRVRGSRTRSGVDAYQDISLVRRKGKKKKGKKVNVQLFLFVIVIVFFVLWLCNII